MLRTFLALVALTLCTAAPAAACTSGASVAAWSCYEVPLDAGRGYGHPINGVRIEATFSRSGSTPISVLAFWDGGATYRVRVALPDAGVWTYALSTDDPASRLNGQAGSVVVTAYSGSDPFRAHGWPRVSIDKRSLTYADQTPFFWLADTAWEMAWSAVGDQVPTYMADRQQKGFNVVQVVTNSHQLFFPWHVNNRNGAGVGYLLDEDHTMLNPAYFARLDSMVDEANGRGIAIALVPIWGTYGEPHFSDPGNGHRYSYTLDEALTHARYVGARYAGHNVVWIIGGDRDYFTEAKRTYWAAYARELRAASGGTHLMTVHAGGYSGSYNSWPDPPEWLDFHMYEPGHYADMYYRLDAQGVPERDRFGALRADGGYHWEGGLIGYNQEHPIPVLSAESNYEDIIGRFWLFDNGVGGLRVLDVDVRNAAYWAILSGGTAGYTYGANGIWSWANSVEDGGGGAFQVRRTILESLSFPGASQMQTVRAYAEAHHWYEWVPAPERVEEVDTDHFVAASLWKEALVVYAPQGSRSFTVQMPDSLATSLDLVWTNPVTSGETRARVDATAGLATVSAPNGDDWLLTVRKSIISSTPAAPPEAAEVQMRLVGPNPARSVSALLVTGPEQAAGRIEVMDALGRRVADVSVSLSAVPLSVALPDLPPGAYFCRFVGTSGPAARYRFVVTG